MKIKFRILNSLFLFIFLSPPLFSHICIDIDEFYFKATNARGLRISVFDSDTQAFKHIGYFPHKTLTTGREDTTIIEYAGLKISHDCKVTLPQNFKLENYIIRTKGTFRVPPNWSANTDYLLREENFYNILYKNVTPQNPSAIVEKLRAYKKSILKPPFKVKYTEEKKPFTAIIPSNAQENKDERKKIGETATTMTMYSFGWFTNFPTQNGSNQGLDGAFLDPSKKFLFLTESKCREENCTADNYLKYEMNESEIISKLKRVGVPKKSKDFIESFIKASPQHVFKATHRIMPSGHSQWAIEPLNHGEYSRLTLTPDSEEKDKVAVFKSAILQATLSTEEALDIVLKAMNCSREDAIKILQGKPVQAPTTPLSSKGGKEEAEETPKSLPPATDSKIQRRLSYSEIETSEKKVPEYSYDRLVKLIQKLDKKLYKCTLAQYAGCDSRTLGRILQGERTYTPLNRWTKLMENLERICKTYQLDQSSLLSELEAV